MSAIDIANEASEKLCDQADWLVDELKALAGSTHTHLLPLAEHLSAEAWRVATLCALAKAEHG